MFLLHRWPSSMLHTFCYQKTNFFRASIFLNFSDFGSKIIFKLFLIIKGVVLC